MTDSRFWRYPPHHEPYMTPQAEAETVRRQARELFLNRALLGSKSKTPRLDAIFYSIRAAHNADLMRQANTVWHVGPNGNWEQ